MKPTSTRPQIRHKTTLDFINMLPNASYELTQFQNFTTYYRNKYKQYCATMLNKSAKHIKTPSEWYENCQKGENSMLFAKYDNGLSFVEIAEVLNCTPEMAHRIYDNAIYKLKRTKGTLALWRYVQGY